MSESDLRQRPDQSQTQSVEQRLRTPWLSVLGSIKHEKGTKGNGVALRLSVSGGRFNLTFNPGDPGYDSTSRFLDAVLKIPAGRGVRGITGSVYGETGSREVELRFHSKKGDASTTVVTNEGEPLFTNLDLLKMASRHRASEHRLAAANIPARKFRVASGITSIVQGGLPYSDRRTH